MGSRYSTAATVAQNGHDPFEARQRDWIDTITAKWPERWKRDALKRHSSLRCTKGLTAANQWLFDLAGNIDACKIAPNASDSDILDIAEKQAKHAEGRVSRRARTGTVAARSEVGKLCGQWGIEPPGPNIDDQGALARMTDPLWWRRKLRRHHGRQREAIAIALGYVHDKRDVYISNESFEVERHKGKRNAKLLAQMEAISEDGEIVTLAELSEHSLSNPALRRGEMMVRIKGLEDVSRDCGHVAVFVTLTCPSRMHARHSGSGAPNENYDGTTPKRAQDYLCRVWADVRSSLKNRYIDIYGIRIAEPHHDGTPHWHMLLFIPPLHLASVKNTIRRYALADSPDESGAQQYRVKFENIDPNKGSAVGYVAKYIGKNVDGTGIDLDESGLPAAESIGRVTAWAHLHGIRQFQFIGGAPVGLWRELRRIKEAVIADAPEAIAEAWQAAQRAEGRQADYAGLVRAVGGPTVKRSEQRIRLASAKNQRAGRYGWEDSVRPFGILHTDKPTKIYQSERKTWQLRMKAGDFGRRFAGDPASAYRPWTRVNNCAVGSASGFPGDDFKHLGANVIAFPRGGPPPELRPG
jgi:hypothetical protein